MKTDVHHLLWRKKSWSSGWNKLLREHNYLKVKVDKDKMHRGIHCRIECIPPMTGKHCKEVYLKLGLMLAFGEISEHDSIERRLQNLISIIPASEQATISALKSQLEVVQMINGSL